LDGDEGNHGGITRTEVRYQDVPLLSFLIAHLAPFFDFNYYLTGTLLIPVLASLFVLPLGVYFFRIGVPVSGLLGGLIGSFAGGYYMRSSIGRIDTDMLNLFFPVLAGLLILLAGKVKTERGVLLYAVGAGLSLFLFQWWYGKSGRGIFVCFICGTGDFYE
jgi:dolichyl-diphosphooligosaccharide--protein glycosyltransferase